MKTTALRIFTTFACVAAAGSLAAVRAQTHAHVIQTPKDFPINDISSLLTAREPGLTAVTSAGLTGQG